jgi:hypothetical protein
MRNPKSRIFLLGLFHQKRFVGFTSWSTASVLDEKVELGNKKPYIGNIRGGK